MWTGLQRDHHIPSRDHFNFFLFVFFVFNDQLTIQSKLAILGVFKLKQTFQNKADKRCFNI